MSRVHAAEDQPVSLGAQGHRMVRRERGLDMKAWRWLRTALGGPRPRPAVLPAPPPVVYVLGTHRSAQYFINWTGEDPQGFRIITRGDQLRGLNRPEVIMIDEPGRAWGTETISYLRAIRARVRWLNLDQLRWDDDRH